MRGAIVKPRRWQRAKMCSVKRLGRQVGQIPKSDPLAAKVLGLVAAGYSYLEVAQEVRLNKNRSGAL
jgi:hypothetical protein